MRWLVVLFIYVSSGVLGLAQSASHPVDAVPSAYTWAGAFGHADLLLGYGKWTAINDQQRELLKLLPLASELTLLPEGQRLESVASDVVEPVNDFLRQEGFDIQLQPMGPDSLALAAVLEVEDRWAGSAAERRELKIKVGEEEQSFPAFQLRLYPYSSSGQAAMFRVGSHPYPVINLFTKGKGSLVYLTEVDEAPAGGPFAVSEWAKAMTPPLKDPVFWEGEDEFSHVRIPMVDLNRKVNVDWMLGMSKDGYQVTQALQQFKLQMNEYGFRAKDGVAMGASRGSSPPENPYQITRKFVFWVSGDKDHPLSMPVFAELVTPEHWREPELRLKDK